MQHPVLRKRHTKPPSTEAIAAVDLKASVTEYSSRWEVQAACKGTTDAAAQLQAAKGLAALLLHVQQHHKATCRRAEVRQHFSQQLPPCLLSTLLSSRSADAVSLTLDALLAVARLLPGLLPVQAAAQLLELLCSTMHGAVAARLLTEQLTHWLFSQLWGPYWLAAGTTARLYQHITQQRLPAICSNSSSSNGNGKAAGAAAAAAALEACAAQVVLLARLASLSEQQVVPQLAGDVGSASRWLHLLVQASCPATSAAGNPCYSLLLDSTCQLLHSLSNAPAVTAVLQQQQGLRCQLVALLHRVLHRPCCTKEADDSSVLRWIHAAHAASLPVLWKEDTATPAAATAAAVECDQLLAAMALSAAATFASGSSTSSGSTAKHTSSSSSSLKQLQQLDAAAVALLAAAVLPPMLPFGSSKRASVSRFMPALLGSDCCHVLLHALAVAAEGDPAAAAATTSVVSGSNSMLPIGSGRDLVTGEDAAGVTAGCAVVVAVPQHASRAWLLLRMICAQCTQASLGGGARSRAGSRLSSGSDSDGGGEQIPAAAAAVDAGERHNKPSNMVQPQQVLRVVQAYAEHIPSVAPLVPRLLGSLHVLLCQAALVTQQQQQQQQQPTQVRPAADSADASISSSGRSGSGSMVYQLLHRAPSLPSLRGLAQKLSPLWESMSSQLGIGQQQQQQQQHTQQATAASRSHQMAGSNSGSGSGHCQGLAWQLPACAYVVLSVALAVHSRELVLECDLPSSLDLSHDGAVELEGHHGEFGIVLAAARMAAAVLQVLLPALLGRSIPANEQQQQQQSEDAAGESEHVCSSNAVKEAPTALQGVVECTLASLQALVLLTRHLQAGLGFNRSHSSSLLACRVADCKTAEEAVAVKAAQAAAAGLAAALDSRLCGLLEQVVSAWPAPGSSSSSGAASEACSVSAGQQLCSSSSNSSSSSSSVATSVQAALQQQLQQEMRCWAAAALAGCYGHLGASSSQGRLLAAARQPGAVGADTELQLADGGAVLPAHAAVLAAGCSVLAQQLQQQPVAGVAGVRVLGELHNGSDHQSGVKFSVKLSAAVDRAALDAALEHVYTGAATVNKVGLAAQLAAACSSSRKLQRQQQHGCALQQLVETGQQQLAGLGRLAKKLQLPLLAALCRQAVPRPGAQLQLLHPQLSSLLPRQVLLLQMAAGDVGAQRHGMVPGTRRCSSCGDGRLKSDDGGDRKSTAALDMGTPTDDIYNTGTQPAAAAVRELANNRSSSETHDCKQWVDASRGCCEQQAVCSALDGTCDDSSSIHGGSRDSMQSRPALHSSSSTHLGRLARLMDSQSTPAAVHICTLQQLASRQIGPAGAAAVPATHAADWGYADVLLAAPAVLQQPGSQQQQQQDAGDVLALLPAHQVLLSGCGYFEALFSQRWHRPWQDCSSNSRHGAAAEVASCSSARGSSGSREAATASSEAPNAADGSSSSSSAELQQVRLLQVVLVPDADVHVAAALLHWLYTGELQVALPQHTAVRCDVAVSLGQQQHPGVVRLSSSQQQQQQADVVQLDGCLQQQQQQAGLVQHHSCQQQQQQPHQQQPSQQAELVQLSSSQQQQQQQQQQAGVVQFNGCSPACHACRTLLRLWRCADLLLLPALQQQCLAAVEAAAMQLLPCGCCMVLLQDCCVLGVAAAADGIVAGLLARFGKEAAAACPEWLGLPAALQDVLLKGWLDKRRQQASSDTTAADTSACITLDLMGSCSSIADVSRSAGGVGAQGPLISAAEVLPDPATGQLLLQGRHSQVVALQQEQQQMAEILQLACHQQQQLGQQPLIVPRSCVAGVPEAMAVLVLLLRSSGLLP